jgi:hypothetical protein
MERENYCELLDLTIVAKTQLSCYGFCYVGYSREHKRLYRPIYRPERQYCYWTHEMNIGDRYQFKVIGMPSQNPIWKEKLPHSNDDLLVVEEVPKKISSTNSDNFGSTNTIQPLSKLVNKLKICSLSSIAFEFPQSESSPFQNSIRTL